MRFHGPCTPTPSWCGLPRSRLERAASWEALEGGDGARVVALATWSRLRDPARAEVAFAVADDARSRHRHRLLEQLAESAGDAGVVEFVAEVLPENTAMLSVFRDAGFEAVRTSEGGTVEIRFPIATTERYLASREERDHAAVVASLRPFFEPRSVAVVGASPRRGSIGGELFRNVVAGGFTGKAYPVNRGGEPVAGVEGYTSTTELPETPDLAVLTVPAQAVVGVAEEALERGTRAVCVISAGFAEVGAEGAARERELVALARFHGARLIGPNCLGIAVARPRLNATFAPRAFPPGGIGFSSQSGALGLALLEQAEPAGLGFSAFCQSGTRPTSARTTSSSGGRTTTRLVVLYLESFGNPRKFARLAPRVSRRKPVLAVKSGVTRTGARAAGSHTAALAGSEAAAEALFHQAGVLRAGTLEELVDVAGLLVRQPLPAGRRVAILTNAGGLGILCADACEGAGLARRARVRDTGRARAELPSEASLANPVDILGSARAETYASALPLVLEDPAVDAAIVISVPTVAVSAEEVQAAGRPGRGVEAGPRRRHGRAGASRPGRGLRLPRVGRAGARPRRRPSGTGSGVRPGRRPRSRDRPRGGPHPCHPPARERRRGLALGGGDTNAPVRLPHPARRGAGGDIVEEAASAAAELGFPAVVKSASPGAHKTETGGIALDLADENEVQAAAARIGTPVLVQPMVTGGPGSSQGSSRTRSSAPSSPSGREVFSRSSSAQRTSGSRPHGSRRGRARLGREGWSPRGRVPGSPARRRSLAPEPPAPALRPRLRSPGG